MNDRESVTRPNGRFDLARRALFASVAALAAGGLAKLATPETAEAADGGNFLIGGLNTSTGQTTLTRSAGFSAPALRINNNSGIGVDARSATSFGLYGESDTGNGVIGQSNGANEGVLGISANGIAMRGDSANSLAVAGATTSGVGGMFTSFGSGFAIRASGKVLIEGDFSATGMKSAVVPGSDGNLRRVFCLESPESYFEDFGRDRIVNGRGAVRLDPEFRAIVRGDNYEVFLTPLGDCKGLYVSDIKHGSFEVREVQGGTSSIDFNYRVAAKRKDIPDGKRLEKVERPKPTVRMRDIKTILDEVGAGNRR